MHVQSLHYQRLSCAASDLPFLECLRAMSEALQASQPTTGPFPSAWTGTVTKVADREAWTYVYEVWATKCLENRTFAKSYISFG